MSLFALRIAWRYLRSNRKRFIPLLTGVAVVSIAVSTAVFILVMGCMRGFQKELNRRWMGLNAHLTIENIPLQGEAYDSLMEQISGWPEIKETTVFLEGDILIQIPGELPPVSMTAKLKGMENLPERFRERLRIYPENIDEKYLLMGEDLAAALGIHPDFPEGVQLIYPFGEIGPSGDWVPAEKIAQLTHIFRTGIYAWDAYRLIVPLPFAQSLLREGAVGGVQVELRNLTEMRRIQERLLPLLPKGGNVQTFAEQNGRLFAALKLERYGMGLLLLLFGLVASFSLVGLLYLFIDTKRKEIAILRGIGLSPKGAESIFIALGVLVGGIGSFIGACFGGMSVALFQKYPLRLPETYYLDYLPVEGSAALFLGVVGAALLLSYLISLVPAGRVLRLPVVSMMREE